MSNSIRFLGAAILAWAAVRAVSLGMIPGTQALAFDARAAQPPRPALPPIPPSALPPIEPVAPHYATHSPLPPAGYGPAYAAPGAYPFYIPVPAAAARSAPPPQVIYVTAAQPDPREGPREVHIYGDPLPQRGGEEPAKLAMLAPAPVRQTTPSFTDRPTPKWREKLSISSWAMMRNRAGTDSLASGGQLGASQAGARVMWNVTPSLAASVRASAPINSQRGAEGAVGLRYQPFRSVPVAFTLERRHAFRDYGRSAFAAFVEGGMYGQAMPWNSTLDGYFQAGIVDFNNPDWFVDGQVAVSRPIWGNLSAGFGVWGGAQPGLHRLDAGPRISLKIGKSVRAHVDYRYMVTGNVVPGSGAVVTLAGDF